MKNLSIAIYTRHIALRDSKLCVLASDVSTVRFDASQADTSQPDIRTIKLSLTDRADNSVQVEDLVVSFELLSLIDSVKSGRCIHDSTPSVSAHKLAGLAQRVRHAMSKKETFHLNDKETGELVEFEASGGDIYII